jgi:hypothetical protein
VAVPAVVTHFDRVRTRTKPRISAENLARDRAFWADLLEARARSSGLPPHNGAGYGHRRFIIIQKAVWVTLYRAVSPQPQIGVFLRCTGLAGEAFYSLADERRDDIEPHLHAHLGPGEKLAWGTSHHPGMIDIIANVAAPLPWDGEAADFHVVWLLRMGAIWWANFARLAET